MDYLEEHGYVERRPDPTNRRATLVCFTDRGWDEADACARILDDLAPNSPDEAVVDVPDPDGLVLRFF